MTPLVPDSIFDGCRAKLRRGALASAVLLVASTPLTAQQRPLAPADPPTAEQQQMPPEAAPPGRRPGLIDAISDFFEKSTEALSLKGAQDAIGDLNRKAGDAAKAAIDIGRIPGTRMASGRTLCVVAGNGAPDCGAAANALCKSQGFGGGNSVATESGEKCPARVYMSGRSPRPGECKTETFVTSAMCQ